jgi:hypothetical protein
MCDNNGVEKEISMNYTYYVVEDDAGQWHIIRDNDLEMGAAVLHCACSMRQCKEWIAENQ